MKNYYEILGVTPPASGEEIKRAYYKLAHQFHPDKIGGDGEKFKEIAEAYRFLSDPKNRTNLPGLVDAMNRYEHRQSIQYQYQNVMVANWYYTNWNQGVNPSTTDSSKI